MKTITKQIDSVIEGLEKICTDLPEVTICVDAEFQAKRLEKEIEKLKTARTNIHGGGTGND